MIVTIFRIRDSRLRIALLAHGGIGQIKTSSRWENGICGRLVFGVRFRLLMCPRRYIIFLMVVVVFFVCSSSRSSCCSFVCHNPVSIQCQCHFSGEYASGYEIVIRYQKKIRRTDTHSFKYKVYWCGFVCRIKVFGVFVSQCRKNYSSSYEWNPFFPFLPIV